MTPEDTFPVGRPRPRSDSFEVVEPDGPELTDEEETWPIVTLQARTDSFEIIESETPIRATEITIRVRCDSSASAAEVKAFVAQLRSAVEGVQASAANRFPVQIILPTPAG